jgi:DNA-binding transcriptional regulator YiaG
MSTLAQTIKNEIRRISRREIGLALSNFRRDHIALKKKLAEQKRKLSVIEKENKELSKKLAASSQYQRAEPGSTSEDGQVAIYARGIKSIRRRLGLSQNHLATWVGMNRITIAHWEKKSGKIIIRKPEVIIKLTELKGMKKREVAARLGTAKKPEKNNRNGRPTPAKNVTGRQKKKKEKK